MSRFKDYLNEISTSKNKNAHLLETMHLGKHNGTRDDVDPKQLKMGIKVEMEHVPDGTPRTVAQEIATRIALDHLAEIKNYYSLLKKFVESKNDGPEDKWRG